MDFSSGDAKPRCSAWDVDQEWWFDPDLEHVEDHESGMSRLEKIAARSRENGPVMAKKREDQTRAKLNCMRCPLLMSCRKAGWQEGHHVWGGLDAGERFTILKAGQVSAVIRPLKSVGTTKNDPIVRTFMAGATMADVARGAGISEKQVQSKLRQALVSWRVEREDAEGWRSQRELPSWPEDWGRDSYRAGRATWSLSERDSA